MLTFEEPPVERTKGVPDTRARLMVLEQIREHGRCFVRLIGFAFFGKPSQRRAGRSLCFDPRGGGIPLPSRTLNSPCIRRQLDVVTHVPTVANPEG